MQAVIELTVSLVSALAMAMLAQLGLDRDHDRGDPAAAERVVARTPQPAPPVAAAERAAGCPKARLEAPIVV